MNYNIETFPLVDSYLKQLGKTHVANKAAVLSADGLLDYFLHAHNSLEEQ